MGDDEWEMVGFCPKNKDPGFGEFQGKVSKILDNGCAFITCQEIKDVYDIDAYCHSTVVQQCSLHVGEEICFNVHVSSSGRPQVSAPCWKRRCGVKRPFGHDFLSKGGAWQPLKAQRLGWDAMSKGKGKLPGASGPVVVPARDPIPGLTSENFLLGTIKMADAARHFSMIQCAETGSPQDTYVQGAVASPQAFAQGEVVAFTFNLSPKGPQAETVFKPIFTGGNELHFPLHRGKITRILPNGNGLVKCDEVSAAFGCDAFLDSSIVQQCGLKIEDIIAFELQVTDEGSPQASAPCWRKVAGELQMPRMPPWPGGKGMPLPFGGGKAPMMSKGAAQLTMSRGGTMRAGPPLSAGPQKGKSPLSLQAKGWGSQGSGSGTWNAPKAPKDTWAVKASGTKTDGVEIDWMPEEFHVGRVCLVDAAKNVSMVRCPASNLPRDVYVHQSVAEPSALLLNDVVCFKIHVNRRGLPQASAPLWKRVGVDSSAGAVRFGEFQGLVARPENGSSDAPWAVDCPDVMLLHGRDAQMTQETLEVCGLVEGNLICFAVSVNQNGDPEVLPPCWICCSSEKWVRDIVSKGQERPANGVV